MDKFSISFEIKALPPLPNQTMYVHWAKKRKIHAEWKAAVHRMACFLAPAKPLERAKITFTRFSSRQCDFDNLVASFKYALDGLKSAGVIIDDNPLVIGQPSYKWSKASRKESRILIEVTEETPRQEKL